MALVSSRSGDAAFEALIALTAVLIGLVIGTLTFLESHSVPGAVIAGPVAAGASVLALDKLVGR